MSGEINYFQPKDNTHWYVSPIAGELTASVKGSTGRLHYLRVNNTTGSTVYAFVFDATSATGSVFVCPPLPIAAHSYVELNQRFIMDYANGLTISSSTTETVYGAGGAHDLQVHALYE